MNEIEKKIKEKSEWISKRLIGLREEVGFTSPLQVAREINAGYDTIYKIEVGATIPTRRTLQSLYTIYRMTPKELDEIVKAREEILELRKLIIKNE